MSNVALLCLPYAGSSASAYSRWKRLLDADIDLVPIEPAGRGRRIQEPFYGSLEEAVADLTKMVSAAAQGRRYVLFGHSMGSLLSYHIVRELTERGGQLPERVFLSGRTSPHLPPEREQVHALEDDELIRKVAGYGAVNASVFDDPQLRDLFLPVLRNDFRIIELYQYTAPSVKITCPATVLYGTEDHSMVGDVRSWSEALAGEVEYAAFPGGHFFIHENEKDVLAAIQSQIRQLSGSSGVRFL